MICSQATVKKVWIEGCDRLGELTTGSTGIVLGVGSYQLFRYSQLEEHRLMLRRQSEFVKYRDKLGVHG